MHEGLKFPLVLIAVAGLSAALLAGVHHVTASAQQKIQSQITERALSAVVPEAHSFKLVEAAAGDGIFTYRKALAANSSLIGYVVEGEALGYSSRLRVMAGVTPAFKISAIKVLYQNETPGLGDKVEEKRSAKTWGTVITGTNPDERNLKPWFQVQFDGKTTPLTLKNDGGEIDAITGATISSRAVCSAVNTAVEQLKKSLSTEAKKSLPQ